MSHSYRRYWLLHELRQLRAKRRVGTMAEPAVRRERKALQRDLVKLRTSRKG